MPRPRFVPHITLSLSLTLIAACTDLEPLPDNQLVSGPLPQASVQPLSEFLTEPTPSASAPQATPPASPEVSTPAETSATPLPMVSEAPSATPLPASTLAPTSPQPAPTTGSQFPGDPTQVAKLIVSPSFITIAHKGESAQFFVIAKDKNDQYIDPQKLDLNWSVDHPELYDINSTGKVTTLQASGFTKVKVSAQGVSDEARVTMGSSGGAQPASNATPPVVPANQTNPFFDYNGDGFEDLLVNAFKGDGMNTDSGRVYVFFGPLSENFKDNASSSTANVVLYGKGTDDNFGFNLTSGDINGDGLSDIITSAYNNDGNGTNSGEVYVFYGTQNPTSPVMATNANVTLTAAAAQDRFGKGLTAGDLNKDGKTDLLIGAPFNDTAGNNRGRIYGYYGNAQFNYTSANQAAFTIDGANNGDQLGHSIALGDFDGDSVLDIFSSSSLADQPANRAGSAYVFKLASATSAPATSASGALTTITGEVAENRLGQALSAGDINGDGKSDLIIASDRFNADAGKVYVFYGGTNPPANQSATAAQFIVNAESTGDRLGRGLIAGDISGDGIDDLILGSPRHVFNGKTNAGAAYVFHGSSTLGGTVSAATANTKVTFDDNANQLGNALTLGYMNTDSKLDLIVGLFGDDAPGNQAGSVRIFNGPSTDWANPLLVPNDNLSLLGITGEQFGKSVHAGSPASDEEEE